MKVCIYDIGRSLLNRMKAFYKDAESCHVSRETSE